MRLTREVTVEEAANLYRRNHTTYKRIYFVDVFHTGRWTPPLLKHGANPGVS
jgi:hypothetical protein